MFILVLFQFRKKIFVLVAESSWHYENKLSLIYGHTKCDGGCSWDLWADIQYMEI